jgi:hypothetical protein
MDWVKSSWEFAKRLGATWLVFLSGIGSVVLTWRAASKDEKPEAVEMWLASYACLIVAACVAWFREHSALKKLQAVSKGWDAKRMQKDREKLAELDDGEIPVLKELLLVDRLHGEEVRKKFPGIDLVRLKTRAATFLDWDSTNDFWGVQESKKLSLKELLFPGETVKERPVLRIALLSLVRELRKLNAGLTRLINTRQTIAKPPQTQNTDRQEQPEQILQ